MSRFETKRYFDTYVARDGRVYDHRETPEEYRSRRGYIGAYVARDGRIYDHKETPEEYRNRKGAGADDSGCGCIALIIIAIYLIL